MLKSDSREKMTKMHVFVLVAACLMAWGVMGMFNAYGLFFTPMEERLGVGRAAVTLHYSLRTLVCGFAAPLVALLLDKKVNPRLTMLGGMILYFVSSVFIAGAKSVILVDILALFAGFGLAFVSFMLITIILGNWFVKNLGTFSGIAIAFSGIGSAIVSPIVTSLLNSLGYQTVYILYAGAAMLMVVPTLFVPFTPESVGLKPYGALEGLGDGKPSDSDDSPKKDVNLNLPYKLFSALYIILLIMTLLLVGENTLNAHLPALALDRGLTAEIGAMLLSSSMIGNLVSKLVLGIIVDKLGVIKGFMIIMFTTLAGFLIILFSGGVSVLLIIGSFLYGSIFSLGALGMSFITRYIYGNEEYNRAFAKITMMTNIGGAVFVTVFSALYDITGSYTAPLLLGIGMQIITILMTLWVAKTIKRKETK